VSDRSYIQYAALRQLAYGLEQLADAVEQQRPKLYDSM
jgi:hypothetical protein